MKVLIADDDSSTRALLRRLVVNWGFEVIEAADGEGAWQALSGEDPPRIALLDWMMPRLDGAEICSRLSVTRGNPLIYAILLTARSDTGAVVQGLDAGAHDFLSKPVSSDELRSRVFVGKRLVDKDDQVQMHAREMARLALVDPLTGIDNRRSGEARLDERLSEVRRTGVSAGLLLFDVDRFKRINDRFGHSVGDDYLKLMASALRSSVRQHDHVARWGGEEFLAIIIGASEPTIGIVADHLRRAVRAASVPGPEGPVQATVSVGATLLRANDTAASALARVDHLLYDSKEGGGDRVTVG